MTVLPLTHVQAEALALISDWTADEREYLRVEAPRLGLQTPFRGGTLLDVARKAVAIAKGGLERRGYDEVRSCGEVWESVRGCCWI